jgi:hypothetical protein
LPARRYLLEAGQVERIAAETRGGRTVEILARTDRHLRKRAFEDAAARKRLLYARYLGWASHTRSRLSPISVAGERVTHASLLAVATAGYRPIRPEGGEITTLFGQPVPGGPLDNGAHLQVLDDVGRPLGIVTLLIEVKSIRRWIYPWSHELYELLDKSSQLQLANPALAFVPVLICRRAHPIAFAMAKDLGFYIIQTRAQYILPLAEVDVESIQEVNTELGFGDLIRTQDPARVLTRRFETELQHSAARRAERFSRSTPILARYARTLRDSGLDSGTRKALMRQLRAAARALPEVEGGW